MYQQELLHYQVHGQEEQYQQEQQFLNVIVEEIINILLYLIQKFQKHGHITLEQYQELIILERILQNSHHMQYMVK